MKMMMKIWRRFRDRSILLHSHLVFVFSDPIIHIYVQSVLSSVVQ